MPPVADLGCWQQGDMTQPECNSCNAGSHLQKECDGCNGGQPLQPVQLRKQSIRQRLPRLSLFKEIRCQSAPNSPRVSYCSTASKHQHPQHLPQHLPQSQPCCNPAVAGARQRNSSMSSNSTAGCYHMQQQHQPPPPPYPGSCRSLVVGSAACGSQHSLLSCQSAASAVSYACHVQEVRELSLGRQKSEPFGMKVECIGEAFFITHVVSGSAAAHAGLKTGDEIVGINGRKLEGLKTRDVLQLFRRCEAAVRLSYRPRAVVARIREVRLMKDNGVVGLRLQKKSDGLYIDFVKFGTPAHEVGLKAGDQVLKVNGHFVTEWSMEGAMALLKSLTEQLVLLVRETLPLAQVPPPELRRAGAAAAAASMRCPSTASSGIADPRFARCGSAAITASGRGSADGCVSQLTCESAGNIATSGLGCCLQTQPLSLPASEPAPVAHSVS